MFGETLASTLLSVANWLTYLACLGLIRSSSMNHQLMSFLCSILKDQIAEAFGEISRGTNFESLSLVASTGDVG